MHIHPSSPNSDCSLLLDQEESIIAADAAIKIQAGFRGYRVRKQIYNNQGAPGQQQRHHRHHRHSAKSSGAAAIMSVPNETSATAAAKAAGCINGVTPSGAAVPVADGASIEDRCATKIQAGVRGYLVRKKQKIATDAATKIQAGFRGFKARKELKQN